MTNKFTLLLCTASLCFSTEVFAQKPYIGIAIATPGEGSWQYAPGKFIPNTKHEQSKKIFVGFDFKNQFSVEAGYLNSGYQFQHPEKNKSFADLSVKMFYAAGKYSMPLGDSINAFAKIGLTQIRSEFSVENSNKKSSQAIRPLLGFGIDFKMAEHLDFTLEFERDGKINHVPQQKLSAGFKWRF